jgi:putative lipoic acid-binding regulatory protein
MTKSDLANEDTLLEFPCKFPIKAMGRASTEFEPLVLSLVQQHAELFPGEDVTVNQSGEGNFVSVTVTIEAQSKAQLDRIYQDLTDCSQVLMAL